jgi:hypothetical protein
MTQVSVYYKMYVPGGHHRQPRNTSATLDLASPGGGDIIPGHTITPNFFSSLPYTLGTTSGLAQLEFWSVTDGTTGEVDQPVALTQTVGTSPMTIIAWYFPVGGDGNGHDYEIIDDAFSALQGAFIDDTFVDVTSDPSLTSQANVVGIVPTNEAETLQAYASVSSTTEPFYKWMMNGTFYVQGDRILNVPQHTQGIAVAIYQNVPVPPPPVHVPRVPSLYNPWWWIESWWGHGPDPGPEILRELGVAVTLYNMAGRASPQVKGQILGAALQQARLAAANLEKQIQQQLQGE